MFTDSNLDGIVIQQTDPSGLITLCLSAADPTTTATAANRFAKGCVLIDTSSGKTFINASASSPSFVEVVQSSENTVLTKTVDISKADILALYTTPITLINAPGAGFYIKVLSASVVYTFDTAAYEDGGSLYIQYSGESAGVNPLVSIAESSTILSATDSNYVANSEQVFLFEEDNSVELANDTGAFTDPGTAAGTATIKLYYTINEI
jgi:hypothetical protein